MDKDEMAKAAKGLAENLLRIGKELEEDESGLRETCKAILDVGCGRWSVSGLAEHLGRDRILVALALLRLEEEGRIRRDWLDIWGR